MLNSIIEQSNKTKVLIHDDVDPVKQIGSNKQEIEVNDDSIDLSDLRRSESLVSKKRIRYPFDYNLGLHYTKKM